MTGASIPATQELTLNQGLLRDILRQRKWQLLAFSLFSFVGLTLCALFLYPQSYTATVSISMEHSSGGSSAFGALLGVSNETKYTGVLKSRKLAEEVENKVHLKELYGYKTEMEAIIKLMRSIKIEDSSVDGLMYIQITLDGPPRYKSDPAQIREKVGAAVAEAANGYALAFRHYLIFSDTNRDSVLLRAAENQRRRARREYEVAVKNMSDYIRSTSVVDDIAAGSMARPHLSGRSADTTDTGTAATELQALYLKRGQLEAEMSAAEATRTAVSRLLTKPDKAVRGIPAEDILLNEARARVTDARRALENLRIRFGEDHPRVVNARITLQQEVQWLEVQKQAILRGDTTENIKRKALQEEYRTVMRQIAQVEKNFQVGRELTDRMAYLQNEVVIALEGLKATVQQYAILSLQTVSAQNSIAVVDQALPANDGRPGLLMVGVFSTLGALALLIPILAIEYIQRSRRLAEAVVD